MLSGEGADELFGGYPMYLQGGHFQRYTKKDSSSVRKMAGAVAKRLPNSKENIFIVRGAMGLTSVSCGPTTCSRVQNGRNI